jgi:hypothetical protein
VNPWLLLVLLCLFVYRVTRLVTTDAMPLVALPREAIVLYLYPEHAEEDAQQRYVARHGNLGRPHWGKVGESLSYLIVCDWCVSVWIATLTMLILYTQTNWFAGIWITVLYGVATTVFTGWFAQKVE